jgi:hypothetical protein
MLIRQLALGAATFVIGLAGGYLASKAWVELA